MMKWLVGGGAFLVLCAVAFFAGVRWHTGLTSAYEAAEEPAFLAEAAPRAPEGPPPLDVPDIEGVMSPEDLERLTGLGYLSAYVEATPEHGVTVHDPERSHAGLNLYTSGHAPEAYLMDMDGEILHTWRYAYEDLWGGSRPEGNIADFWRRAHVFENGDVIAIFETLGIFKVDKDSKLLWARRNSAHHDLYVHEDGTVFTLTQQLVAKDWLREGRPVYDDFITHLEADGTEIRSVSILDCLYNSAYAPLLRSTASVGEVLHTNALKYLDGRHEAVSPIFKRGNFLISIRELGLVAIVDIETESVVWALAGQWFRQHDPSLLENGHILLFDNLGNSGKAKVVEVHPFTQDAVWTYGEDEGQAMKSPVCGNVARLPNGNTLINEACQGRAFEVTPDDEIVWQFLSPHRPAEKNRLRATLLDITRLPQSFSPAWLQR